MPSWPIDMPAYGRLVHDFCEKLGIEGATVVGNSMGGFVAVEAATTAPGRFSRLVLVSAAGILNTWNPEGRATATAYAWKRFGPQVADRGRVDRLPTRAAGGSSSGPPSCASRIGCGRTCCVEQMAGGLRGPGFGDALRALMRHDIRERLGTIEMPTMIVWGQSDRVIPMAAALSYHRRIPHSRLEIFERTGHVPQLERPARFNALLDDFLAE